MWDIFINQKSCKRLWTKLIKKDFYNVNLHNQAVKIVSLKCMCGLVFVNVMT